MMGGERWKEKYMNLRENPLDRYTSRQNKSQVDLHN